MVKSIFNSTVIVMMLFLSVSAPAAEVGVSVEFTDSEATIIRAYYRDHATAQNAKKNKAKGLPPGIAKNLQRGKPLPPGIAKQALPNGLVDLLPPPPSGYERIEVSGKVLLVEVATQVISDVLEGVIVG